MAEGMQKTKKDANTLKRVDTVEVSRSQIVSDIGRYDRLLAELQVRVDSANAIRDTLVAEIVILDAP